MQYTGMAAKQLPSGRWKVVAWGRPDRHITDRRGANYRTVVAPGQPARGFPELSEARGFLFTSFPSEAEARAWATLAGDGSALGEAALETLSFPA
jgi:hypothetical protein